MKRKNIIIGLVFLVVFAAIILLVKKHFASAQDGSADQLIDSLIKIERINDKVILVRFGADAITALTTQKGMVIIDAGISVGLTAKYRKIIENEFQRKDFTYLINTHGHPDHCGGNAVFADAVIIGHENCLKEIAIQCKDPEKLKSNLLKIVNDYDKELKPLLPGTIEWTEAFCQKSRYQFAYNDVIENRTITKPTLTFNDSLSIEMGDVTFNLIYFGKAHSESDIIIHIPEMKILMVGDLFSKYGKPSIPDNNSETERWVKVVDWIETRLPIIDIVIGGHGQILTKEDLQSFNSYIKKSQNK
jgi:glyoxylase-like metal-dependent hydrolase (beta-lactamase superfamily II)